MPTLTKEAEAQRQGTIKLLREQAAKKEQDEKSFYMIGLFQGYVAANYAHVKNPSQGQFDKLAEQFVDGHADAGWSDLHNPKVTFDLSPEFIRKFMEILRKEVK